SDGLTKTGNRYHSHFLISGGKDLRQIHLDRGNLAISGEKSDGLTKTGNRYHSHFLNYGGLANGVVVVEASESSGAL
ncbi:hypothetical protein HKBW3S09_00216, partial [Candidatus Hakubella thermalkaliphila]